MNKIEQALVKSRRHSANKGLLASVTPLIDHMHQAEFFTHEELDSKRIVHPSSRHKQSLNYFRELRASLAQIKTGKVILVTSVCPSSGSSFIALNLSAVIALDHSRTSLLVDAHIDHPSCTEILELDDDTPGLTDFFDREGVKVRDVIRATGIKRLKIISAGQQRELGKEYFTGKIMRNLIRELRERYRDRTIIIDSPCIMTSADARILADYCDCVLLVAPYGKVSNASILEAVDVIGKDKLAGVVINKMY